MKYIAKVLSGCPTIMADIATEYLILLDFYEILKKDDEVDLIFVTTQHNMACKITYGEKAEKSVFVEKAFSFN